MFMCDIPPHDMSSDFLVMAEQREIEAEKLWQVQVSGWQEVWGCASKQCGGVERRCVDARRFSTMHSCVFAGVLSFSMFICVHNGATSTLSSVRGNLHVMLVSQKCSVLSVFVCRLTRSSCRRRR